MSSEVTQADQPRRKKRTAVRGKSDEERFWTKVDRAGGLKACWPWMAGTDKDGYGKFQTGKHGDQRHHRAHRFARFLATGRLPKGLVLHSCDNPPCCNPRHLEEGSQLKNRRDAAARQRTARGERVGNAVLTENVARDIRRRLERGESPVSICRALGIKKHFVHNIKYGNSWKWL